MLKKTEKEYLKEKNRDFELHISSTISSMKVRPDIFSAIIDENTQTEQISQIKKRLIGHLNTLSKDELIDEIVKLTWVYEFLIDIALRQEDKIARNKKTAKELALKEEQYKEKKASNRKLGAQKANERHDNLMKVTAKNKWAELSDSNKKPCGYVKLFNTLMASNPDQDWKQDTIKYWVKTWKR
jgi:hypothetical protein